MEKFFTNKSIWKKIVVAVLIIMSFQVFSSIQIPVYADTSDEKLAEGDNITFGGVLLRPVVSLFVTIGDGIVNLLHMQIMGQERTLEVIDLGDDDAAIGLAVLGGIIAAIVVAAAIATGIGIIVGIISAVASSVSFATIGASVVLIPLVGGAASGTAVGFAIHNKLTPGTLYLPTYSYSAEEIFKGNILLFNVDFFNADSKGDIYVCYEKQYTETVESELTSSSTLASGAEVTETHTQKADITKSDSAKIPLKEFKEMQLNGNSNEKDVEYKVNYYFYYKDGIQDEEHEIQTSSQDSALMLRETISRWYVAIRNICLVAMLSVLVYVGIRMLLSTVASDKAKYKEMLKDWLVGICLLFIMHYIMAFTVTIAEKITDLVATSIDSKFYFAAIQDNEENGKIYNAVKDTDLEQFYQTDGENKSWLIFPTNLMGHLRLEIQKVDVEGTATFLGYAVCFLILVIFTVLFTFTYFKRLLYMAFLTLIAPFVALTYCIDKINDGQAQGFNMWLKEYIFNLLIQPMHLILYFILVSSAIELAGQNVIYSLVALGFMFPAEKLLRSMFGFEKAKTPPLLGGPIGASLMMQGINGLSRIARGGKGSTDQGEKARGGDGDESSGNRIDRLWNVLGENGGETEQPDDLPAPTGEQTRVSRESGQENQPRLGEESGEIRTNENPITMADLEQEQRDLDEMAGEIDGENASDEDVGAWADLQEELDRRREQMMENQNREQPLEPPMRQVDTPENDNDTEAQETTEPPIRQADMPDDEERPESRTQPRTRRASAIRDAMNNRTRQANTNQAAPQSNKKRSIAREYGRYAGRYFSSLGEGAKVELKNRAKKLPKAAFKLSKGLIGGAVIGGAVGTVGMAAAIATGDEKNIITAAGAAAGAGYAGGRRVARATVSSHLSPEAREAFDQIYHGNEYKADDTREESRRLRHNDNNRIKIQQSIIDEKTTEQIRVEREKGDSADLDKIERLIKQKAENEKQYLDETLKDGGYIDQLYQAGITNMDQLTVLSNGIANGHFSNVNDAAANMELYKLFGRSPDRMKNRDRENFNKTLHTQFTSPSGGNMSDAQAKRQINRVTIKQNYIDTGLNS